MKIKKTADKTYVLRNGLFGDLSNHTATYRVFEGEVEVGCVNKSKHGGEWTVYLVDHSTGEPQLRPYGRSFGSLHEAKSRMEHKQYNPNWRAK